MITLEILCWENDYRRILSRSYLHNISQSLNHEFSHRRLLVNQVILRSHVKRLLGQVSGFFDEIIFVEDFFSGAMDSLNVEQSFTPHERQYSRGQFVGLDRCGTRYLFHINADIELKNENKIPFLQNGIEVLQQFDNVLTVSPKWAFQSLNGSIYGQDGYILESEAKLSVKKRDYFLCKGFSDNCFLVDTERLRSIDWNTQSDKTNHYPNYAGLSFEKRVGNYISNNNLYRAIDPSVTFVNSLLPQKFSSKVLKKYNAFVWKSSVVTKNASPGN